MILFVVSSCALSLKTVPLEMDSRVVSADPPPEGPRLLNIYGPGIVVQ